MAGVFGFQSSFQPKAQQDPSLNASQNPAVGGQPSAFGFGGQNKLAGPPTGQAFSPIPRGQTGPGPQDQAGRRDAFFDLFQQRTQDPNFQRRNIDSGNRQGQINFRSDRQDLIDRSGINAALGGQVDFNAIVPEAGLDASNISPAFDAFRNLETGSGQNVFDLISGNSGISPLRRSIGVSPLSEFTSGLNNLSGDALGQLSGVLPELLDAFNQSIGLQLGATNQFAPLAGGASANNLIQGQSRLLSDLFQGGFL